MLKRFWPLLTVVTIVVLAAIIIPAAAELIPHFERQTDPNTYDTILYLDSPSGNFPDDVQAGVPFEVSGYLYFCHYEIFQQYEDSVNKIQISLYKETGVLPSSKTFQERLNDALTAGVIFPLPDRRIVISTEFNYKARYHYKPEVNTHTTRNVYTDQNGYFQTTIQIDNIKKWYRWVAACYYGETQLVIPEGSAIPILVTYKPEDDKLPRIKILPSLGQLGGDGLPGTTPVITIVITMGVVVFAILFLGAIAYFIYRYRKKLRAWLKRRKVQIAVEEPANTETLLVSAEAAREVSNGDPRVEILFPQIEKPLPLVWGVGELLTIIGRALIETPENEINSKPQIRTEDHAIDITIPDFTSIQIEHSFDRKGETAINVNFGGDTEETISGTRKIRIVDYREEIVEMFNGLIDLLSAKGI